MMHVPKICYKSMRKWVALTVLIVTTVKIPQNINVSI